MSNNEILLQFVLEYLSEATSIVEGIAYGFVCGSLADGTYLKGKSDIDVFVCLNNEHPKGTNEKLKKIYLGLHKKFHAPPDNKYPGEIMPSKQLQLALSLARRVRVTNAINDSRVYDGLVWAGMLSGKKIIFVMNNPKSFQKSQSMAKMIINRWGNSLNLSSQSPYDKQLSGVIAYDPKN